MRRKSRRAKPLRIARLNPETRAVLRDIITLCLRAQGVGQDMTEALAVESVIGLIEAGFARIESWAGEAGETRFRIAILTEMGWR